MKPLNPNPWIEISHWGVWSAMLFFTFKFITDALIYRATVMDLLLVVIGWVGFWIAYRETEELEFIELEKVPDEITK
jgi:hypothetical protein